MKRKNYLGYRLLVILTFLFMLSGCGFLRISVSDEEKPEETKEEEIKEEEIEDVSVGIPDDETLLQVIEKNARAMEDQDFETYMETIHSESPIYESTMETLKEFFAIYRVQITLEDTEIIEKSETEARIKFTQFTSKIEGPDDFMDNLVKGYHILRPDNGVWKLYETQTEDIRYIRTFNFNAQSQNITVNEDLFPVIGVSQHFSKLENLEFIIDDRDWKLDFYEETDDFFIAEFVLEPETVHDWSELFTIHYFQDLLFEASPADYIDYMEFALSEEVTGSLEFNQWAVGENEGFYEFIVQDDPIEDDQHELARLFTHEYDFYLVRYTIKGDPIDENMREFWIQQLSQAGVKQ